MQDDENFSERPEPLVERATDWVNEKLYPYLGPPPLGPYDAESTEPESAKPCPICHRAMREHIREISPDTGHVYLHHPDGDSYGVMEVS